MSSPTTTPGVGQPGMRTATRPEAAARELASFWWMWLVTGILWVVASLVILQFNSASITTIGVIVGCMFIFAGFQQIAVALVAERLRWLAALFGLLFLACGVVAFVDPANTFAGLADVLGFLFLVVGVWWTVQAFLERAANSAWWLGLIAGVAMIVLAFWTSGQFFLHRSYVLLAFAGIWALFHGITDIARAFAVRSVRDAL